MREPMGLMTDTKPRKETAVVVRKKLAEYHVEPKESLRLWGSSGHVKIVALIFSDRPLYGGDAGKSLVFKFRANSGRWTKAQWVRSDELRPADPKEKRYRDALASLKEG